MDGEEPIENNQSPIAMDDELDMNGDSPGEFQDGEEGMAGSQEGAEDEGGEEDGEGSQEEPAGEDAGPHGEGEEEDKREDSPQTKKRSLKKKSGQGARQKEPEKTQDLSKEPSKWNVSIFKII